MSRRLGLFEGFGIELEYMICHAETLDVAAVAEPLLREANNGVHTGDLVRGRMGWSNELVAHVVELKTNGPAKRLTGLAERFHGEVLEINRRLAGMNAKLVPTAMHPWMNPLRETKLWPGQDDEIYRQFDRIFNCKGHGWSNLQSMHINLPFNGDEEFGRLHAAIRVVLPLLPALAASSPFQDGKQTGRLDNRLFVYRGNCAKIPLVTGHVIPEPVFTEADYSRQILRRMYRQIAPWDSDGILQHEWLNARGAIARFDRGTIEIRVLDIQECPKADLAIANTVVGLVDTLVREQWSAWDEQRGWSTLRLARLFEQAISSGMETPVRSRAFTRLFGVDDPTVRTMGALWRRIVERLLAEKKVTQAAVASVMQILDQGPLATRILRATGTNPRRPALREVYDQLADCLANNRMFPA